jgi:hypothetical protein
MVTLFGAPGSIHNIRRKMSPMPEENPSEMIYLNNAATSWPKPPGVRAALGDSLARPVFGSGRTAGSQGDDFVTQAREALTRFF